MGGERRDFGPSQCWRQIDAPASIKPTQHVFIEAYIVVLLSLLYSQQLTGDHLYVNRPLYVNQPGQLSFLSFSGR